MFVMRRRELITLLGGAAIMMLAGRRVPAFFPASSATANMLSDSGANERPASIALYSYTICR